MNRSLKVGAQSFDGSAGLSPEQKEFLERKKDVSSDSRLETPVQSKEN